MTANGSALLRYTMTPAIKSNTAGFLGIQRTTGKY